MQSPNIAQLVGDTKKQSDISTRPIRVPYNESTTIEHGKSFRLTFPRSQSDEYLDCRNIRLRYNLQFTNSDPQTGSDTVYAVPTEGDALDLPITGVVGLDGNGAHSIFSRVVVRAGSTILYDLQQSAEVMSFLTDVFNSDNDCMADLVFGGHTYRDSKNMSISAAHNMYGSPPNAPEFYHKIMPKGTILNTDCVLPMGRLKEDLSVEFFLRKGGEVFSLLKIEPSTFFDIYNLHTDHIGFQLKNTEIICNYIKSPSISTYFSALH